MALIVAFVSLYDTTCTLLDLFDHQCIEPGLTVCDVEKLNVVVSPTVILTVCVFPAFAGMADRNDRSSMASASIHFVCAMTAILLEKFC
jgi:uncharacterized membrane protein YqhA